MYLILTIFFSKTKRTAKFSRKSNSKIKKYTMKKKNFFRAKTIWPPSAELNIISYTIARHNKTHSVQKIVYNVMTTVFFQILCKNTMANQMLTYQKGSYFIQHCTVHKIQRKSRKLSLWYKVGQQVQSEFGSGCSILLYRIFFGW